MLDNNDARNLLIFLDRVATKGIEEASALTRLAIKLKEIEAKQGKQEEQ